MLAYDEVFFIPLSGCLATILLTTLLRNKLKIIVICPLPTIICVSYNSIFHYVTKDSFTPSASSLFLVLSTSTGIGIFLTITTIAIVYAIKHRYHPDRYKKFVFTAACCLILYLMSYVLISRHGMQISEEIGFKDYYFVTVPEYTNTWYFLNHTYSVFYYIPICIESTLGTAEFAWCEPLMVL